MHRGVPPPPTPPLAHGPPLSRQHAGLQRPTQQLTQAAASAQPEGAAMPAGAGRHIVIAADSSADSQYALRWTVAEVWRPGDMLHVVRTYIHTDLAALGLIVRESL